MSRIRKNDMVQVITGSSSGKKGKVLLVDRARERILVEGVNFVWKHMRRSQEHRHGARIRKEASINISNVKIVCQACGKPTKIDIKRLEDGKRVRICRLCKQGVSPEE
ncbi:MAG: 50S ribosomal protein L24 [Planctomycetota bacterium]|jgi:large subunit ribosomal protein L24